jgi:hypothetical protein
MVARSSTSSQWLVLCLAGLFAAAVQAGPPLFDAHLHYDAEDAARYPPEAIVATLRASDVRAALVTSRPPERVLTLYAVAPELILPMLGVYRTPADKESWAHDAGLPARVARALEEGPWRAVGELHLFADDRHSPVFMRIVELATSRGLPLQLHCDPAVIDAVFARHPQARLIWAHAGAYPYPPLLSDYLRRYPNLYIDLSVRDQRIAPGGELDAEWELLFLEFPERFMVGVDTYRTARWDGFAQAAADIRHWLAQLPDGVSEAMALRNAARVFGQDVRD